ncbi:MAG: lipoyl synthase [Candidatus Helarchaeota archaeon]
MSEKPEWIRRRIPPSQLLEKIRILINDLNLNTICENALCPNIGLCFERGIATFLIMGDVCTRNCKFCAVKKGTPLPLDKNEPEKIAIAIKRLNLSHVVITSVTRDDLPDFGASHFVNTVNKIREINKNTTIELLIPDFQGNTEYLDRIINCRPEIINHNIEMVPRLYSIIRPNSNFERSLRILKYLKENTNNQYIKTGMMIGLGETDKEIFKTIEILAKTGCDILTIGQYLRPSKNQVEVVKYYRPEFFKELKNYGLSLGFKYVYSDVFVRSSFNAKEVFDSIKKS